MSGHAIVAAVLVLAMPSHLNGYIYTYINVAQNIHMNKFFFYFKDYYLLFGMFAFAKTLPWAAR